MRKQAPWPSPGIAVMGARGPRPAHGAQGGHARGFVAGRIGQALIQHHHDVAAQGHLNVDGRFRGEHVLVAVEMRAEQDAVVCDLAEAGQADHLESAGVGEDGVWPGHEAVEAAQAVDGLRAGAERDDRCWRG